MENAPDITPIFPEKPGETSAGYVKMPIPFVGIYQSMLGADIDSEIDQILEYYEDGDPFSELKIHYEKIYKSIALYTADLLGIDGAIYAGTVKPLFYNYVDDQPYLFVPEAYYKAFFNDTEEFNIFDERMEILNEKLRKVLDPWYLEEYGGLEGEYVGQAVYAQWMSWEHGNEVIYSSLEFVD